MSVEGWIKGLEYIKSDIDRIVIELVKVNEEYVLNLNRVDQLFNKGIRATGLKLPDYSSYTVTIKQLKGQPFDKMTLKDTGSFHKGFFITYSESNFTISSRDIKTDKLVSDYSENIFGLTDENMQKLIDYLRPYIINLIKKVLNEFTNK